MQDLEIIDFFARSGISDNVSRLKCLSGMMDRYNVELFYFTGVNLNRNDSQWVITENHVFGVWIIGQVLSVVPINILSYHHQEDNSLPLDSFL